MKDGVRLAADLFVPVGAKPAEKFPAVFQYDPYRKDDNAVDSDAVEYFVARGYVGARVDIRGTGRSEGHTPDREYSRQEMDDGDEIIAWLAKQPWSSGTVGMFGLSWSGFNAIQLAMRNPPALKAIITACSTERLYSDDVHYSHGIMQTDRYDFAMDSRNPYSPSPEFPIDTATLRNRFDNPPWELLWLRHQRDDAFWHKPEKPLSGLRIPVLMIGGFVDLYRDSIPRFLTDVKAPVRAIVGPWGHDWPHDPEVGPAIEWRDLAVRWWDRWLKGRETGVASEPKLAVYMRHWFPPDSTLRDIPGEWRTENGWPPRDQRLQSLYLRPDHALGAERVSATGMHRLEYVPSVGRNVGLEEFDLQPDQRPVDSVSLVYDSAPLEKQRAILGFPDARLRASASAPSADWFVRLSDVAPGGEVTLITEGALNGAQRDSMSHPQDLEPGKVYSLRVPMHFTSWVFPAGHRIRLSISNAQWPMFWPTPYRMRTSLYLGGDEASRLILPIVPIDGPMPAPHFSAPARYEVSPAPVRDTGTLTGGEPGTPTMLDLGSDKWTKPQVWPWGTYWRRRRWKFEVHDDYPELASWTVYEDFLVQNGKRQLLWHAERKLRSDKANFYYEFKRELRENGKIVREKQWRDTIPRDHQ